MHLILVREEAKLCVLVGACGCTGCWCVKMMFVALFDCKAFVKQILVFLFVKGRIQNWNTKSGIAHNSDLVT